MKNNNVSLFKLAALVLLASLCFVSCSEKSNEWDPYYSWESRNALWFAEVADSARTAIAEAKAQYGNEWEEHCQWRMFRSLQLSSDVQGVLTDSIICKIVPSEPGTVKGTKNPNYTDYVQLHYRAWLMPSEYISEDNVTKEEKMAIFSQSYYGDFNPTTAVPVTMSVEGLIEGFQTALQYMVEGDKWYVYIPQQLAYGTEASSAVPAYSTLLYLIDLVGIYETEDDVPDWK
ncbi:MAG: FKBP-type peptidyl-prolyl cis-trans isomerase [Bacteroidaceae bacterium]|nr:FKBP-type peptidyl-prolyl cis-trans isomerase [Bacteroidaceae bacterium]